MDCSLCYKIPTATGNNGGIRKYKADSVRGKPVTAIVCGDCIQSLIRMGFGEIPWEKDMAQIAREKLEAKPKLRLRKEAMNVKP